MRLETWLLFLVACVGLSLSPGPNSLLALTHGALYGRRHAAFTIAGGALGFAGVIALSMFGIGALIQASIGWLTALKWVGGAYLVYLGVLTWRAPPMQLAWTATGRPPPGRALFRQGALSALTNPKALLFFGAFLPQFLDPEGNLLAQFLAMAGTFVMTEVMTEWVLASTAQRVRPWLGRMGRRFNRACGGVFVAMGVVLPLRT